jgi:DNA-binding LacI/PurR family transcriptional regulator
MKRIVSIDKNLPVPIYYQIKEKILGKIKSGELPPKTKLPSELELANANNVSPMTVRQAYTTLVNQGFLYRRHGKGTYVNEAPPENNPVTEERNSTDIGVVFSKYSSVMSFYSQMLLGIESACKTYSYHFHMIATNDRGINSRENFIISSLFTSRLLDGLIVAGPLNENEIHTIKEFGIPLVLVDNDYRKDGVVTVVTEDEKFIETAFKKLIKEGRKKIAILTGPMSVNPEIFPRRADKLLKSYRALLQKTGLQFREDFIKTCDSDEDAGYMAVSELLNSNERPDAIIVNGDVLVKSAVRAARKFKVKIPEDIEILNYGDSDDSPCCLISKPLFEMGETAVELLKKIIKDDKIKKTRNIVPLKG